MKKGLTERVRQAARELEGPEGFGVKDLADRLGIQDYAAKKRLGSGPVCELLKKGELERLARGRYRWVGKGAGKPSKQEVMWRYLRARRAVTVEDLQEMAGVTADYVRQWLRFLVQQGLVKKAGDRYRLVNDQIVMPKNVAKLEYLRRRQEVKKQALAALDQVFVAVAEARMAVAELEEG